ncbi:MAG: SDR family oxidoreductase [Paludibacteraceae bacterium]|nr:SDR family oxidoreductase [Paludibacteraceae bacterium]
MQTLLLTGGSSGIGLATVQYFAGRGWRVFELSRHGSSYKHGEGEIIHFDCDVCDEFNVKQAVTKVMEQTDHIDVVISNAGYGISGAIEFTLTDDARHQFDVNFFGAHNLMKAVLPILREQKGGRIIFTSSVAAVFAIPYQAFYSASKSALNAYALALQNELRDFNIHVSVMMPGDVATGFTHAREKNEVGNRIYTRIHAAVHAMERDEQAGMRPHRMAVRLYHLAVKRNPEPQHVAGFQYKFLCFLDRLMPKRFSNWIVGKMY